MHVWPWEKGRCFWRIQNKLNKTIPACGFSFIFTSLSKRTWPLHFGDLARTCQCGDLFDFIHSQKMSTCANRIWKLRMCSYRLLVASTLVRMTHSFLWELTCIWNGSMEQNNPCLWFLFYFYFAFHKNLAVTYRNTLNRVFQQERFSRSSQCEKWPESQLECQRFFLLSL